MSLKRTHGAAMQPDADGARPLVTAEAGAYRHVLSGAGGRQLDLLEGRDARPPICTAIYVSPPYDMRVPPLSVPRLSVNLTGSKVSGGIEGTPSKNFDAQRHSLFLVPRGEPVNWQKSSPSRHLTIYFDPELFDTGSGDGPGAGRLEALFNTNVPGLGALAAQLAAELESPGICRAEAADSLGRLMLIRVARFLERNTKSASALTPTMLAQLKDHVLAHLSERILVADMARQVNLSPGQFARSFVEQTGQSPHTFVLQLRLSRAAQLLRRSKLSLIEITQECGFASQQHLNNVLKRHLGATPGRLRAGAIADRAPSSRGPDDGLTTTDITASK